MRILSDAHRNAEFFETPDASEGLSRYVFTVSTAIQLVIMCVAAIFEVGGDALIRRGLTGGGIAFVVLGFLVLGSYGVVVNLSGLDFTRMIGVYIGWFTLVSMLFGRYVFGDRSSGTMWLGVGLVLLGSVVIQVGARRENNPTDSVSYRPKETE